MAETGPGHCILGTMRSRGEQYVRHNNLSPRIAPRMPHNTWTAETGFTAPHPVLQRVTSQALA